MAESVDKNINRDSSNKNKGKKKELPWWVELLFVQIGLPETLLRDWLKAKVNLSEHISNQKNKYVISFISIGFVAFISPLIEESINKNKCVKETVTFLKSNDKKNVKNDSNSFSISVNHCNGGNYFSSELLE